MSEDMKHDEIIAEVREKYTVHHCGQCEFRKSCLNKFDSDECKNTRQSIMLGFGIEDGCFTKLLDRLEAAHKREATCEKSSQVGNAAKMRETLRKINKIASYYDDSAPNRKKLIAEICDLARIALAETKEGVVK